MYIVFRPSTKIARIRRYASEQPGSEHWCRNDGRGGGLRVRRGAQPIASQHLSTESRAGGVTHWCRQRIFESTTIASGVRRRLPALAKRRGPNSPFVVFGPSIGFSTSDRELAISLSV